MSGARALRKLDAALTGLPAPWRVLRNRRARATDGPPWTKYIALHQAKGIALIDLFPANPHAAIAPLDEFLARTGFLAFSRGDPPIVAIALTERDIGDVANRLAEGFATAQPCGIQNPNWADAVVDLLVSTPGLLLTALERESNRAMPGEGHRAPRRDEPQTLHFKVEPSVAPSDVESTQRTSRVPREPQQNFRVEPSAAPSGAESRQRTSRVQREPQQKDAEPASPEPRLGVTAEPDFRIDRVSSFEHRRRWRVATPWILGASAAALVFAISFPEWHKGTSGLEGPPDSAAQQTVEIPSTPPVESLLPRTTPVPAAPNVAPPAVSSPPPKVASAPHTSSAPVVPSVAPPAASTPQPKVASIPRASPAPAPPNVAPPKASTPQPKVASVEPPAKTFTPPSKGDVGSSIDAGAIASHAAPAIAPAERGENAHAPLSLKPPRSPDARPPETASPESPENEETVTIDGVTYVQGRQPHALGMLSEPQSSDPQSSTSELIPNRDGDNGGVLIQPLQ